MSLRNVHKTNENLGISQFSQLWEQHSKLDPEKYRGTPPPPPPPILFDEKIAVEFLKKETFLRTMDFIIRRDRW